MATKSDLKTANKRNIRDKTAKETVTRTAIADGIDAGYDYTDSRLEAFGKSLPAVDQPALTQAVAAEVAQALTETLTQSIDQKVEKVEGKGLSTEDYTSEEKELLGQTAEAVKTLPEGTLGDLVQALLGELPGFDLSKAQTISRSANGVWVAVNVDGSTSSTAPVATTPTPEPTPTPTPSQPALLTASRANLEVKDFRDLSIGGAGVDRFVRGKDGVGWNTGGNTGNFPRKATLDTDFVVEATFRADSQKAYLGMVTDNNNALNGWSAGVSVAIIDGRLVVNKNGVETDLGAAPALSATTKLALLGTGANVTLWTTTDSTTYTKVSGFTHTRTGDTFFMVGADGPAAIYNIQHVNLTIF